VETPISIKQARRNFIKHLESWSLHRRTTCNFFGKITPIAPAPYSVNPYALGEAVICELLPHPKTAPVMTMVVRLFSQSNQFRYHMTIRYGSGWEDERIWFARQYQKLRTRRPQSEYARLCLPPVRRPSPNIFLVTVRPLFNKFTLLPIEIQQRVFEYVVDKSDEVKPGCSSHGSQTEGMLSLATILSLSRPIYYHITPWFFRTTTFHFGTSHLTNFLRGIGPKNRRELRKLAFSFGKLAVVHVARYFVPDEVFTLFNPALTATQHYWRVALRDSLREVSLTVLTIKVDMMIKRDVSVVEKSLLSSFANVDRVCFENENKTLDASTANGGKEFEKTWYLHT
jgi:hypothetical protein